jgi:hypothetical protein
MKSQWRPLAHDEPMGDVIDIRSGFGNTVSDEITLVVK